jgi:5-carboxymethyl-2-hydroxymuconate isomerase
MVNEIREKIPSELSVDEKKGQVVLLESDFRAVHTKRSRDFIWIEIIMYSGRNLHLKQGLASEIIKIVQKFINVPADDINLVYYEVDKENFYSGVNG